MKALTQQHIESAPPYVHRLLDAWLSGKPLDFGGAAVPDDIRSRLEAFEWPRPRTVVAQRDSVLATVEQDLSRMHGLESGVRGSLAQIARRLAKRMDETDDGTSETAFAGLAQQLRTTLMALTEVGSDGTLANALYDRLSTPVRDASDAEPDDAGTARRANRGDSREAVDAVAKGTRGRGARGGAR